MKALLNTAVLLLLAVSLRTAGQAQTLPAEAGRDDVQISAMANSLLYGLFPEGPIGHDVALDPDGNRGVVVWSGTNYPSTGTVGIRVWSRAIETGTGQPGAPQVQLAAPPGDADVEPDGGYRPQIACDWARNRCLVIWWMELDIDPARWLEAVYVDPSTGQALSSVVSLTQRSDPRLDDELGDLLFAPERDEYLALYALDSGAGSRGRAIFIDGSADPPAVASTTTVPPLTAGFTPSHIAASYDPTEDDYVLAYPGTSLVGNTEVYVQHLLDPVAPFQVSVTGDGVVDANVGLSVDVATDPTTGRYLAVWHADGNPPTADGEDEIYGQLLETAPGGSGFVEVGPDDVRISFVGGPTSGAGRDAFEPAVAWDSNSEKFAVVWHADDPGPGLVNNHYEIFLQTVDRNGNLGLGDELQLSTMGPSNLANYDALEPAIATSRGRAYVAWVGAEIFQLRGTSPQREEEIFGQLIDLTPLFADGFESGTTAAWTP